MNLRTKLLVTFIACGLVPTAVVSFLGASSARRGMDHIEKTAEARLEERAFATLESVRDNKRLAVEQYFQTVEHQIQSFSENGMVVDAMRQFRSAYRNHDEEIAATGISRSEMGKAVRAYYDEEFARQYAEANGGKRPDSGAILSLLAPDAMSMQYSYIAKNPNRLGSKHQLDSAREGTAYDRIHADFHPVTRSYLERFGYYDIFLVDDETGQVVYTVFKELDFGTSLLEGPWASSGLAEAFQKALGTNQHDGVNFSDFANYTPSYEAPASFIASPIYDGEERIGVAIFQMPLDQITSVMAERGGLGDRGESYLVGADKLMRSDSYCDPDHRSVVASFRDPKGGSVATEAVTTSLNGKSGYLASSNYADVPVLTAYTPVDVFSETWALVVELPESEALSAVQEMMTLSGHESHTLWTWMAVTALCALLATAALGLWQSRDIGGLLDRVVDALGEGAEAVNETAARMAGNSAQLADASRTQAASLEETASSLEELSAMTSNNADNATEANGLALKARSAAERSDATLEELRTAIERINESSGKISSIIKVIEEIAFQTNLLALNAAVEAARAGDHGRGFAVVADEVRNLAQKATDAARETSQLIEDSVSRARQGRTAMEGVEVVLREIAGQVTRVSELMDGISSATAEQARGVEQISRGADKMDQMTQQTAAVAENAASVSRELTRQASDVRAVVDELEEFVGSGASATYEFGVPKLLKRTTGHEDESPSMKRAA
ncbi:MAG: methyl-accepting chemotaxis protein [Candidatus Eisenbacteria bacterium]|nr:methyl-accepting chemotaxis protein [Candidatus Eisenbacteria bacterium]